MAVKKNRTALLLSLLFVLCLTILLPKKTEAAAAYAGTWQSGSGGKKIIATIFRPGKYRLTVSSGGKTLTVSSSKSGTRVKKAAWKKAKTQLWVVRKNSDGSVSFLPSMNKKLALSITKSGFSLKKKGSGKSVRFRKAGKREESNQSGGSGQNGSGKTGKGGIAAASDGVKQHGWLRVSGTRLVDESGKAVVLHGMSSHGLQWYSNYTTSNAIGATAAYGANLFRVAMYTEEGGYLSNKAGILQKLYEAVDSAISRNMYVIVDWHILSDGNPKTHQADALAFFEKTAKRYANTPNVLYEICNEPNGGTSWRDIKSYASQVIPVIRKESPKSVIIVGTPTWSQDVDIAAGDPLSYHNVLYAFHFYAGTHGQWMRDKVSAALEKGAPIFVSEWGTSAADGNGGVFAKETKTWVEFMKKNQLSWANWSLADKNESSAALKPGTNAENGISLRELSASGKLVFAYF